MSKRNRQFCLCWCVTDRVFNQIGNHLQQQFAITTDNDILSEAFFQLLAGIFGDASM